MPLNDERGFPISYETWIGMRRIAISLLMNRWEEPCPECGLCNKEWQAQCHHDWCLKAKPLE